MKTSLLQRASHTLLERFLQQDLGYDLYAEVFLHYLTEILQELLPGATQEEVERLTQQYHEWRPNAVEKVEKLLRNAGRDLDVLGKEAKTETAQRLLERCARREPDALNQVNKFLTSKGMTMDDFMADGLVDKIADIEQIDRSMTIAENRRNASLREIDRRRTALGQGLRRTVQDIEEGEFKVLERAPAAKERERP